MKSLREYLDESILDPVREKLSPDLWVNNKLKASVKAHILKKFEVWLKNYADVKIKTAYFLGGMTGYQYTNTSDIDINIVIPISDEKAKELFPILPNGHNFPKTSHPVNYHISTKVNPDWKKAGSIYDMLADKWIKEPEKEETKSIVGNYRAVIEIVRFFAAGLNSVISEYERDVTDYKTYKGYLESSKEENKEGVEKLMELKLQEILADIDSLDIADYLIHSLRKKAFTEDEAFETRITIVGKTANESINNLIYKYLEKLGYFTKIREIKEESKKWEKA